MSARGAADSASLDEHTRAARRRARLALLALAIGIGLLLFGRWHVLRIDQELEAENAERTTADLYAATWPYMLLLALGLLASLGGVLITTLSWMYMRDLEKARERTDRPAR